MPFDAFPRVLLSEPGGSSAQVLLYGAQVVSWKNERGEELLFKTNNPLAKSTGGIYVSLSQLGTTGQVLPLTQNLWSLDSTPLDPSSSGSQSSVDLIFQPIRKDFKTFPSSFELRLHVSLGPGRLTLIPSVKNTDNNSLSFIFGLRNYLSVSDISEVRVEGLETLDYMDCLLQRERFTEQDDAITFDGEVFFCV
ncbi:hypothetical protein KY290_021304 [Solanum tuberosum]|uniref:Uncharacterized protein n=1 Tax=Solanum tuberosum TaxID=4113 RepID=A0ABQ7V148_SOLTU|nr:hypothetical protein KY285_020225 [Solanum tuberosum]KAH0757811.1 hypothetical protein KY290_021304 [Solanum tuberosum]